jgi:hypothetical protein
MLEQAIVDAQALREAALKNAEQALIEKFAPQIKDAVESLLEESVNAPAKKRVKYEGQIYSVMEVEDGKYTLRNETTKPFVVSEAEVSALSEDDLLQEEEGAAAPAGGSTPISAPPAFGPGANHETPVQFTTQYEEPVYEFDLSELQMDEEPEQEEAPVEEPAEEPAMDLGAEEEPAEEGGEEGGADDLLAGLNLQEGIELEEDDEDELVNEIMKILGESDDLLEEELIVDMGHEKDGTFRTDKETLEYYRDMQSAKDTAEAKAEEEKEKNKSLKKENENLKETLKRFKLKNKQYKDAVEKLSDKLNETLLSNAKLIYSNKTLGDASLNERQKNKIVEAIAKARTPEEAKNLHEALNATVTSGQDKKSPRTLSESVTRKSTLSGILPRRKQQVNESEEHTFAEKMKKLAGIK